MKMTQSWQNRNKGVLTGRRQIKDTDYWEDSNKSAWWSRYGEHKNNAGCDKCECS